MANLAPPPRSAALRPRPARLPTGRERRSPLSAAILLFLLSHPLLLPLPDSPVLRAPAPPPGLYLPGAARPPPHQPRAPPHRPAGAGLRWAGPGWPSRLMDGGPRWADAHMAEVPGGAGARPPGHGQERSWPGASARLGCSPLAPQINDTRSRNRSTAPDPPAHPHHNPTDPQVRPHTAAGGCSRGWVTPRRACRAVQGGRQSQGSGLGGFHSAQPAPGEADSARTRCDMAKGQRPLC